MLQVHVLQIILYLGKYGYCSLDIHLQFEAPTKVSINIHIHVTTYCSLVNDFAANILSF